MRRILTGAAALTAAAAALTVLPGTAQAARRTDFQCAGLQVDEGNARGVGCEPQIMGPLFRFRISKEDIPAYTYQCVFGHIESPGTVLGENCVRV